MKFISFTAMLFLNSTLFGQYTSRRNIDQFAGDIEKNIFRLTFMVYDDIGFPVTFSYEREIKRPFTFVLKAGPSFDISKFGPSDNPYQYSMNAFASAELRYYYNLKRRIRKSKTVRNFSGIYLALEQSVLSGPIIVINQSRTHATERSSGTFTNIGYQKQFKQGYFNAFLGAKINVSDLKEGTLSADTYHIGIALGVVLFE